MKKRLIKKFIQAFNRGYPTQLDKPLTDRQIDILYRAACGEKTSVTSQELNISETRIVQLKKKAIEKLQSENVSNAIHRLTRLGYLPVNMNLFFQTPTHSEVENASA